MGMPAKKYRVQLTEEERQYLKSLVSRSCFGTFIHRFQPDAVLVKPKPR